MEQKHYMEISRFKEKFNGAIKDSDLIHVSEKLDGSNASIGYDATTGEVVCFSRKKQLTPENNLRGFYEFVMSIPKDLIRRQTQDGRLIIFGEWLCLSGDTIIKKASAGKGVSEMTLREMYQYKYTPRYKEYCKAGINKLLYLLYEKKENINEKNFNKVYHLDKRTTIDKAFSEGLIENRQGDFFITKKGEETLKEYYFKISNWGKEGFPSLYNLNLETDEIQTNKMLDIVYTGKKEVYKLITHKGYSIKATLEHPFLTPIGWKKLKELKEYDCVAITDFISRNKRERTYGKGTREILRQQELYKKKIGKCEKCGNTTCLELHHIDENHFNNNENNWMVLCKDCHKNIHLKTANTPKFDYEFDYIVDIIPIGVEDCYDISMEGNENLANFIANNFIVHNCKHSVSYPNEAYNHFYIYDIWDTATKSWKSQIEVQIVVHTFKMQHIDVRTPKSFYFGFFKGWEHLYSLVGQTAIGAQPCGEGIVIKNQSKLYNSSDEEPAYIKIVSEKFSEVHEKKPKKLPSLEELEKKKEQEELAKTIITERRIQKFIEKMVDNGILPEDWDERCLGLISKQLPREIYHDCLSEEPEVVAQIDNFGKICGKITMEIVRSLIK